MHGILAKSFEELKFQWKSPRVVLALFYLTVGSFEVGTMFYRAFTGQFNLLTVGEIIETFVI